MFAFVSRLFAQNKLEKQCKANDGSACLDLGVLYVGGKGVRQDKFYAKELFGKACDLGEQMGCDNYKILNEQGY